MNEVFTSLKIVPLAATEAVFTKTEMNNEQNVNFI